MPARGAGSTAPVGPDRGYDPDHEPDFEPDVGLPGYSGLFTAAMIACFCLVGALVLRVAAQQGTIAPGLGTAMGLTYCAALMVAPLVARRWGWLREHETVLQHCAVLLVPLIVLEMLHTYEALSAGAASVLLLVYGLGGATLALRRRRSPLVIVSLLAALTGLVGLGFVLDGLAARTVSVVLLAGAALAFAHLAGWSAVRPWVLAPLGVALALAVGATAFRESVPEPARALLLGGAGAIWLLVLGHHLLRGRRLEPTEAAWLPAATLWVFALVALGHRDLALTAGGLVSAAALMGALALGQPARRLQALGLAATGGLLAAATLPFVDATSLGLIAVAAFVWLMARRLDSPVLWGVVAVDALAATLAQLLPLVPWEKGAALTSLSPWAVLPGVALLALWALVGVRDQEEDDGPVPGWVAAAVLGCALLLMLASALARIRVAVHTPEALRLGTALTLAVLSGVSLAVGRLGRFAAWRSYGLLAFAALGLHVLFLVLPLGGSHAVMAVVILGLASGVTSWGVRRTQPAGERGTVTGGGRLPVPRPSRPGR